MFQGEVPQFSVPGHQPTDCPKDEAPMGALGTRKSCQSLLYIAQARVIWCLLLRQCARWAFALALDSAGRSRAAKMAMMAITTSNSISVNARRLSALSPWSNLIHLTYSYPVYCDLASFSQRPNAPRNPRRRPANP